ncbi:hypothetical protein ROP_46260 [Rhodococcus opacus B4]|uniref:Uncharacterized protein n=1 Tax=Rhodococcus opacus (strain B4) TaxID=632772 RepID=C1BB20_RHOOB|nr:hypothetical protein ROP_46260 [Rhodococcus opacus B4]
MQPPHPSRSPGESASTPTIQRRQQRCAVTRRSNFSTTQPNTYCSRGANSQPMRVQFVRSDDGRRRLLEHPDEGNRAKTTSAPVTAILW